jgi:hypothetical protein
MMMKTYSHIRRQALNEAAAALEPTSGNKPPESNLTDSATTDTVSATSNPTDPSARDSAKHVALKKHRSRQRTFPKDFQDDAV